jgi:nitrate reductase delta subunit
MPEGVDVCAMNPRSFRLGFPKNSHEQREAIKRVQVLTRRRFELDEDAAVFVSEAFCSRADCPPLQTVVAFWTEDRTRRQFKVFKQPIEILMDDLPPAWLADALASFERDDSGCC